MISDQSVIRILPWIACKIVLSKNKENQASLTLHSEVKTKDMDFS